MTALLLNLRIWFGVGGVAWIEGVARFQGSVESAEPRSPISPTSVHALHAFLNQHLLQVDFGLINEVVCRLPSRCGKSGNDIAVLVADDSFEGMANVLRVLSDGAVEDHGRAYRLEETHIPMIPVSDLLRHARLARSASELRQVLGELVAVSWDGCPNATAVRNERQHKGSALHSSSRGAGFGRGGEERNQGTQAKLKRIGFIHC